MKRVIKALGAIAAVLFVTVWFASPVQAGGSYSFSFGYNGGGYGGHFYGGYYGGHCRPVPRYSYSHSYRYCPPRVYYAPPPVVYVPAPRVYYRGYGCR